MCLYASCYSNDIACNIRNNAAAKSKHMASLCCHCHYIIIRLYPQHSSLDVGLLWLYPHHI